MMEWAKLYKWELLLAVLLGVVYLGWLGSYGLFDVDEAIFTQATREMVADGTYGIPTYNGVPRYQKPPLIYWVQAGFMQVLGVESVWAARLPSAVFGLASVALLGFAVWHFTRNRVWALWAAAALGLNLSFVVVSHAATADGVLNFFMLALALWCVEVLYGKRRAYGFVVTGVLTTLGLLAKGPVAGIPAALVVLPVLLAREDRWELWRKLAPFKVIAVVAVCLLPWLGLLESEGRLVGFFTQFFLEENFRRFGPGLTNTQGSSPLFYVVILAVGFMPWVFALPAAVREARRDWNVKLQSRKVKEALPYLALLWACGMIGLFMLSGTKLAHYIVPAYPALAIVVGAWAATRKTPKLMAFGEYWVLVQVGLLSCVTAVLPTVLEGLQKASPRGLAGWLVQGLNVEWPPHDVLAWETLRQAVDVPVEPFAGLSIGLLIAGCGTVMAWRAWRLPLMMGGMGLALACAVGGVVPVVWQYVQAPLASVAADVQAAPAEMRIIHLGMHKPSILYLSQRPFTKLEKPLQLPTAVQPGEQVLVLAEQSDVAGIGTEMARLAKVEVRRCVGGYCEVVISR